MSDALAAEALTRALEVSAADLLAYLERRVGIDDAPDLLGELMVTAWRRAPTLPPEPEQARMWLFGIARNVLLNATRAAHRRWRLADKLRAITQNASAPPADVGADVRDAIRRLRPDDSELIRLVHWDGFSLEEAANIMGIPASTARSRYSRAKGELRVALSLNIG